MTSRNQYARLSMIVSPVPTSSVTPSPVGRVQLEQLETGVPCRVLGRTCSRNAICQVHGVGRTRSITRKKQDCSLLPSFSLHSSGGDLRWRSVSRVAVPARPPPPRFLYFTFVFLHISIFYIYISLYIYILYFIYISINHKALATDCGP